jgi:hypothetical protein
MKIVTSSILVSVLIIGLSGAAYAQSETSTDGGMGGAHFGSANGEGVGTGLGTGLGTGIGTGLGAGTARGATTMGGGVTTGAGAATNNMRVNGTSLNMSPNPRAPNVAGTAFAPR